MIDQAVRVMTRAASRSVALMIVRDLFFTMAFLCGGIMLVPWHLSLSHDNGRICLKFLEESVQDLVHLRDFQRYVSIGAVVIFATLVLTFVGLYRVAKVPQGRPSCRRVCCFALCLAAVVIDIVLFGLVEGHLIVKIIGFAISGLMLSIASAMMLYVGWHRCCLCRCRRSLRYIIGSVSIGLVLFAVYGSNGGTTSYPDFVTRSMYLLSVAYFPLVVCRWGTLWGVSLAK